MAENVDALVKKQQVGTRSERAVANAIRDDQFSSYVEGLRAERVGYVNRRDSALTPEVRKSMEARLSAVDEELGRLGEKPPSKADEAKATIPRTVPTVARPLEGRDASEHPPKGVNKKDAEKAVKAATANASTTGEAAPVPANAASEA